jgi:hypothetical protein
VDVPISFTLTSPGFVLSTSSFSRTLRLDALDTVQTFTITNNGICTMMCFDNLLFIFLVVRQ